MTDSGWHNPGGDPPAGGPYGGPTPPPQPSPNPQGPWDVPGGPTGPAPGAAGPPPGAPGVPGGPPGSGPWQQPAYGAPLPGPQQPKRWPLFALVGAVVLLIAAILGVLLTSGDDDETSTDDTEDTGSTDDTTGGTEPDGPTDPNAFVDEEGGYAVTMPDNWVYASLHGDLSGVGQEMFPDDAQKASLVQNTVGALPRVISFYGVVAEEVGVANFVTNVNINATSAAGVGDLSYDEFAGQVRQGIDLVGATPTADEPFTLAGEDGVRVEFDYAPELGASGVQYAAIIDGQLWVVNFASADVASYADEFDAIATSFEITG